MSVQLRIHPKSEKRKYLKKAKQLLQKQKPIGSVGPFLPSRDLSGEPLLERCSSDPTVAGSGALIQRVNPTVRNGSSNPVANRKCDNDPSADDFVHIPHEKVDRDGDEPNYGSTNLVFSDCTNDYGLVLSSTPIAKSPTNFAPESDTSHLGMQLSELKCQLRVQTDVNRELKRLLVASMGSDLQYRLNQIAEEKASISQSLDASLHRLAENHEEIDRVSIECDIWRSKFLASRLMVDELASWKAEITRQLKKSQRALQCMLKESTELGSALIQCNCHLNEVITHLKLKGCEGVEDDCSLRYEGTVLEMAQANFSRVRLLHKHLCLLGGAENVSIHRANHIIGNATTGERMARQVLKSRYKAPGCIGERLPSLPSPSRHLHEDQAQANPASLSHSTVQQYLLGSRTSHNILFRCNRCRGEILNV